MLLPDPEPDRPTGHIFAFTHGVEGGLTIEGEGDYVAFDSEYGPALEIRSTTREGITVRLLEKALGRTYRYRICAAGAVTVDMVEPYHNTLRFM